MELSIAVNKFLKNLEILDRSPATITAYSKDLEQLQKQTGDIDVKKITTKDLEKFIKSLEKRKYTNKTISRKLNSVKSLFKYLVEQKDVLVDPSKPIPHPDIKKKLPNVLSKMQYTAMRAAAKGNPRLFTLMELMLQTGLRIGEISRLKLEHLQLGSNPAQILVIEHGSSPMRLVELNDRAKEIIEEFLPQRMSVEGDEGFLFNTKTGSNMIIRNIRSAINRVFKKAEIEDATVNDIRNTFITFQLSEGVSLAKVAQVVGHKRFSSTEKYMGIIDRKKPGKGERIVNVE